MRWEVREVVVPPRVVFAYCKLLFTEAEYVGRSVNSAELWSATGGIPAGFPKCDLARVWPSVWREVLLMVCSVLQWENCCV